MTAASDRVLKRRCMRTLPSKTYPGMEGGEDERMDEKLISYSMEVK